MRPPSGRPSSTRQSARILPILTKSSGCRSSHGRLHLLPSVTNSQRVQNRTFLRRATAALADEIPVVELTTDAMQDRRQFEQQLDAGEAAALALAEHRGGLLVTDDGPARSLARDRDVHFTGTIGVLVELVETETVDVDIAREWLTRLVDEASYRAPSKDLSEFL